MLRRSTAAAIWCAKSYTSIGQFIVPRRLLASTMTTPPPPPSPPIEVERKFVLSADIETKLSSAGAHLQHEQRFGDVYYDSGAAHLYLSDHWLRRRDCRWELKCPPEGLSQRVDGATQYAEYENEAAIVTRLRRVLPDDLDLIKTMDVDAAAAELKRDIDGGGGPGNRSSSSSSSSLSLQQLVDEHLSELASYVTERRTYRLGEYLVVLDRADFGYELCEIERVVETASDVDEARRGIDALARTLGLDVGGPRVPGKINVYLRQRKPQLFEKLRRHLVKNGKLDA